MFFYQNSTSTIYQCCGRENKNKMSIQKRIRPIQVVRICQRRCSLHCKFFVRFRKVSVRGVNTSNSSHTERSKPYQLTSACPNKIIQNFGPFLVTHTADLYLVNDGGQTSCQVLIRRLQGHASFAVILQQSNLFHKFFLK